MKRGKKRRGLTEGGETKRGNLKKGQEKCQRPTGEENGSYSRRCRGRGKPVVEHLRKK